MAQEKYTPPSLGVPAFHCPSCGVYSRQFWEVMYFARSGRGYVAVDNWRSATCDHCQKHSMWLGSTMVFPSSGNAPLPNSDMPQEISEDFEEARSIASRSPRGAAALLRLCIQKLCIHLKADGDNLNSAIADLVDRGLPKRVQQALDSVRVIGNEAVHPGTIDLSDNPDMAAKLFGLVNFITEKMITEPQEIDRYYGQLPEEKRQAIEKRDSK